LLEKIQEFGLEGVVAKRRDSIYLPGQRPGSWVKKKIQQTDEFIVGGYIPDTHGVDELLVGRYADKKFMFVECVKNGFVPATRRHVHAAIKDLKIPKPPFAVCQSERVRIAWILRRWPR
jgi:bifunctional non-homologous end joining protein LigD